MSFEAFGTAAWARRPAGEIEAVAERDGSILVVPVGSIEQHGKHLPVATDSLLVTAIVDRACEALDSDIPLLVTPTLWTGHSPHHESFGGTISLDADAFLSHLEGVVSSALGSAFDAVLLVNGHGGNIALLGAATSLIGSKHPGSQILGVTYFRLATEAIREIRDTEQGGMGHGGEFETSLLLHFHPNLVDLSRLTVEPLDEPYEWGGKDLLEGGSLTVYREFEELSDSGILGDPSRASAEKGERLAEPIVEELGEMLRTIHEQNRPE